MSADAPSHSRSTECDVQTQAYAEFQQSTVDACRLLKEMMAQKRDLDRSIAEAQEALWLARDVLFRAPALLDGDVALVVERHVDGLAVAGGLSLP